MEPPEFVIAFNVSVVNAICLLFVAIEEESLDDDFGDGAETTNHLTLPPSRAADIDVISPIPPGGDMTTTFFLLLFDEVVADNDDEEA